MLPPIVTYWHDYVQALNPRTPSLLGFTPTQAPLLMTLRLHSKVSDHFFLLIFVVVISTTPDLEYLQRILPIENLREFWVQNPRSTNYRHKMHFFLSQKALKT